MDTNSKPKMVDFAKMLIAQNFARDSVSIRKYVTFFVALE